MTRKICLTGEIHTHYRQQNIDGYAKLVLGVSFSFSVTDHRSLGAARDRFGLEETGFGRDHKSVKVNRVRIQTIVECR